MITTAPGSALDPTSALPALRALSGRIVVIKFGGNAIASAAEPTRSFARDITLLRTAGVLPVVVHGGGPMITAMLDRLGIAVEFRAGLRVTTPEVMDVVRMVLLGQVQRDLVGAINTHGPLAVGLSGADGGLFQVRRTAADVNGRPVDIGLVGEIVKVDTSVIRETLAAGRVPVVSSVAPDRDGVTHNVNADTAAGALAAALSAHALVMLTDVPGVYSDWPDRSSLLADITDQDLEALLPRLAAGMRPKASACVHAVRGGAAQAAVVDGRVPHATLRALADQDGGGTRVRPAPEVPTGLGGQTARARWAASMMDNYGTPPICLVKGSGSTVWDSEGTSYLDLVGGIAVTSLGHCHPAVVNAVRRQVDTLGHVSNLYANIPAMDLAERLLTLLGGDGRALFCNSGAEANEIAFKIARRTGRRDVVAALGGFHGRTMGALAITGQDTKRAPFEPMVPGARHIPYGDVAALAAAVDENTAAVFLEPIQGEGGIVVPSPGYLRAAREITATHGALLVLDEVQTGIGRTGTWFAHQAEDITPDVVTLAKGLGGGLPIGACLALGDAAALLTPGQHGTTFGGNPVCCAAATAVLDTIERQDLLTAAGVLGARLATGVEALGHRLVDHVRGRGLLLGIALTTPIADALVSAARAAGYLINAARPDVLRLAPALTVTDQQVSDFLADLPMILDGCAT